MVQIERYHLQPQANNKRLCAISAIGQCDTIHTEWYSASHAGWMFQFNTHNFMIAFQLNAIEQRTRWEKEVAPDRPTWMNVSE